MNIPDIEGNRPKLIRVWFDTVLNPIIDGLKREKYYARKKNWTWKSFNNNFEYIKYIHQYINIEYSDNAEQLSEYYPVLNDIAKNHDNEINNLKLSCESLFNSLIQDKGIEQRIKDNIIRIVDDDNKQSYKLDELPNIQKWICEYIVNNVGELDSNYILYPIWNPNRKSFLSYLQQSLNKSNSEHLEQVGDSFLTVVEKSIAELKKLRNSLSMECDVPIKVPRIENTQYSSHTYG